MAAVPVCISGLMFDKKKGAGAPPVTCFIVGVQYNPTLSAGHPLPPPGIEIPPDLGIWPNPPEGIAPHPEHPIVLPPNGPTEPPPEEIPDPPPKVAKPGWNWAPGWSQWIWVAIPGSGQAQPKK